MCLFVPYPMLWPSGGGPVPGAVPDELGSGVGSAPVVPAGPVLGEPVSDAVEPGSLCLLDPVSCESGPESDVRSAPGSPCEAEESRGVEEDELMGESGELMGESGASPVSETPAQTPRRSTRDRRPSDRYGWPPAMRLIYFDRY